MPKVGITETVLRDAHQSLIATRMKIDDMLPILEKLDSVGYHSLEAWGGATFDACLRFLDEDPWERLRKIRSKTKTKLQMLLRGQNILAYKNFADDVVEYFVQKSIANGIDILRIFDALNDARNIETAIKACKKEGGHAQGTVCYTISPVHNLQHFVNDAKQLVEMGSDSICIKDMAGLLTPYAAFELVKAIKENVKVPVQLHTHYTSGVGSMTYLKAIEAGVDVVDCAISPMALGTSQPATEPLVATLKNTPFDTGLDLGLLSEIAEYFRPIKDKYLESGLLDVKVMGVDVNALIYQVPGGMLSNLVSQLKQSNAVDKYEEVLKEVPRVREDFGYPPLVTPTSQIVGTQAVLNVLMGERYKMVPKESKALVKGEYGKTPAPIPAEITNKILGDEEPITCRPADLLSPELDGIRDQMKEYLEQEEDVLSYALFPQVAENFFKLRQAGKYGIDSNMVDYKDKVHPV
ncbi:oxaloacetate decarboxylase subunit alpha [Pseudobacteroides cellulosolvens]|uniref:Oxaloacetate decarboxylase n=1 Tax=Pseudobacteroides cellulosolvens ATCC 35603 = DSM 2933 TaxID=398512 RepID=A0A0L6JLH6_9FIRM|nr:oxaloacetate decarboxylase subunit alpha [Pseudobacteroides cellulosolvens]KNY26212.1 Oxaloacetate decarboxylase [Pseudobacteroides cellulosolvens ATCC 35603 = DSM 2933]